MGRLASELIFINIYIIALILLLDCGGVDSSSVCVGVVVVIVLVCVCCCGGVDSTDVCVGVNEFIVLVCVWWC